MEYVLTDGKFGTRIYEYVSISTSVSGFNGTIVTHSTILFPLISQLDCRMSDTPQYSEINCLRKLIFKYWRCTDWLILNQQKREF